QAAQVAKIARHQECCDLAPSIVQHLVAAGEAIGDEMNLGRASAIRDDVLMRGHLPQTKGRRLDGLLFRLRPGREPPELTRKGRKHAGPRNLRHGHVLPLTGWCAKSSRRWFDGVQRRLPFRDIFSTIATSAGATGMTTAWSCPILKRPTWKPIMALPICGSKR